MISSSIFRFMLVIFASASANDCTICSNDPSETMTAIGEECSTFPRLEQRCNTHDNWTRRKSCQLSCYQAGVGYEGDVCCTEGGGEDSFPVSTEAPAKISPVASPILHVEEIEGKKGTKKVPKKEKKSKKAIASPVVSPVADVDDVDDVEQVEGKKGAKKVATKEKKSKKASGKTEKKLKK